MRSSQNPPAIISGLTRCGEPIVERNIIDLITRDQSNMEFARDRRIAPETVKTHVKHIFIKLEVDKRTRAVCGRNVSASSTRIRPAQFGAATLFTVSSSFHGMVRALKRASITSPRWWASIFLLVSNKRGTILLHLRVHKGQP
jgi:DNA-binding CsgD family transcriptional regulator